MSKTSTILAAAAATAALTLTTVACGSSQANTSSPATTTPAATTAVASSLATAHLGCHYYAGGSVADSNPNVVITVTAGSTYVTGTIREVTVGGPQADNSQVSQAISVNQAVNVPPGQTQQLGPFDTGDNSPLGNIVATVNCNVLSYKQ